MKKFGMQFLAVIAVAAGVMFLAAQAKAASGAQVANIYASPTCENMGQKSAEGASCVTNKGVVFARVKDAASGEMGWQDSATKRIWFDEMKTSINQYNSEKFCSGKKSQVLPSKEDFALAEEHGFRDILKDMKTLVKNSYPRWFWSSTPYPDYSDVAYVLDGVHGCVDVDNRSVGNDGTAARCASSAPGVL